MRISEIETFLHFDLPVGPGLGIDLNLDEVRRHPYHDNPDIFAVRGELAIAQVGSREIGRPSREETGCCGCTELRR